MKTTTEAGGPDQPGFEARELAEWSGGCWEPRPPLSIGPIASDTRHLAPGALYLALAGERFDGHRFVGAGMTRGACGAIVRADWPREVDPAFPLLRVVDTETALRQLAAGYRRKLAPRCIGITGSAGKTTVKELTAAALATQFATARSLGNWNNQIGVPLSLLAMPPGTQVGVFELGTNHPGEIGPLAAILRPDWGIVTNIGAGHIEFFHSVQAIADEKADLVRALPANGLAFLNRDGPWFAHLRRAAAAPVVTVSTQGDADYRLRERSPTNDRVVAEESATGERFTFRLGVAGEFQAANALLAIAVARRMGVEARALEAALSRERGMPMRRERIDLAGVRVINDAYNANPLSMRAALEALRDEPVTGGRWLVLGGMLELGDRTEAEHVALGRDLAGGAWAGLIVVGKLGKWIAQGAEEAGLAADRICRCPNAEEAGQVLRARVQPGDGVLLKASRGSRLEEVLQHWKQPPATGDKGTA